MSKQYDRITAVHYSAFRPSLHLPILKEYLGGQEKYEVGLDVGAGTGQSSIALAHYCEKVIGIEPSKEMLKQSFSHERVEYVLIDGPTLNFEDDAFDLVTFAGSLYYAKSQVLLDEIVRVSKNIAKIVVYDFELFLDDLLIRLNVDPCSQQKSSYNHQENFSGLSQQAIKMDGELKNFLSVEISLSDLSHLLLSSKDNYRLLLELFGEEDLYDQVFEKLQSVLKAEKTLIEARTFLTGYRLIKW